MSLNWNPFSHLSNTSQYSFAKFLSSNWWHRVVDTFIALQGDILTYQNNQLTTYRGLQPSPLEHKLQPKHHNVSEAIANQQMGVLDYLFPIPRLLRMAVHAIVADNDDVSVFGQIGFYTLLGLYLVTDIAKALMSAAITLVLSVSVTLVTHLVALPIYEYFRRDACENINAMRIDAIDMLSNGSTQMIPYEPSFSTVPLSFLSDQLEIHSIQKDPNIANTYSNIGIEHILGASDQRNADALLVTEVNGDKKAIAIIEMNKDNAGGIDSLLTLNLFNATQNLELEGTLADVSAKSTKVACSA